MKLTFYDRYTIGGFLPQRAGYVEAILAQDIRNKVKVSQKEIKEWKIINTPPTPNSPTGGVQWVGKGADKYEIDVEFSDAEKEMIYKDLNEKDKGKQIDTDVRMIELIKKLGWKSGEENEQPKKNRHR